jgi:hypothetical protein
VSGKKNRNRAPPSTALARARAAQPYSKTRDPDGQIEIKVNHDALPPPDRLFVSNWLDVREQEHECQMTFGQMIDGKMLAALVILVGTKQTRDLIVGANPTFSDQLLAYCKRRDFDLEPQAPLPLPSDRLVVERASVIGITFTGDEAEARFYRVSPTELRLADEGRSAEVFRPVVEIAMHTQQLGRLITRLVTLFGVTMGATA